MNILWGGFGIFTILLTAYLFSNNKQKINKRVVIGGLIIHVLFAFIVLKWSLGNKVLTSISGYMVNLLSYANEGVNFLFGGIFEIEGVGFIFAFQVLTTIIFFSSLISILYYFGVMQYIIKIIGGFIQRILGTSKVESITATSNIFVGCTEAPLVIRPYINRLTQSELFAVMVAGLSSVAGSVLLGYSLLGVPLEYLIAASFMSAPASLLMAKIIFPENMSTKEEEEVVLSTKGDGDDDPVNVIDAAAKGASDGLKLALNIGAMLLAFIAIIALLNGILGYIGGFFNVNLSIEQIFGYLFSPIAFIIGIPWAEAVQSGQFLGLKLVLNEFVAFSALGAELENLSGKSILVLSFALCGFANFSVIAILLGGLGSIAPKRRTDIAKLGFKALFAATLANFLSAAVAGMFY
ncbi:NupC/NupG family nucleoside CNT transporter [Bacillus sp. SCS-151]|uniref:NupC/NupG family nucleoside CNT transporter n=1 Tax=Nanhaiella sioensis TaxID=3115293 RepID=UPI003979AB9C